MSKPLVSVIIPCFNYGHLLPEALDSVLNQDYKNIEIIIINDGSIDNTDVVAKEYSLVNDNIAYHYQKNKGIVKTRNKGIELAKGEYFIQLDADDWIDTDYVSQAVELAVNSSIDIVYTDILVFGRDEKLMNFPEHNLEIIKYQNYIHASALVNASVFKDRRYDGNLEHLGYEDWDIFLDACLSGASAELLKGPVLHYRKHQQAASRSDVSSSHKRSVDARIYLIEKYLKKYPVEMNHLESTLIFYKKIQKDYEKSSIELSDLKDLNKRRSERIKFLEREILTMKQSKFWKLHETYWSARNRSKKIIKKNLPK